MFIKIDDRLIPTENIREIYCTYSRSWLLVVETKDKDCRYSLEYRENPTLLNQHFDMLKEKLFDNQSVDLDEWHAREFPVFKF